MADRRKRQQWPAILLADRPGAPALADWVLRMAEASEGLSIVPRIAAVSGFSEPTVRAGGPVKPAERKQFFDRLEASLLRRVVRDPEADAELAAHIRDATYPTVFAAFAGGYSPQLLEICDAMDRISEAVATCRWTRPSASQAIVELGTLAAARAGPSLSAAPDELAALDAMLLVLAKLDMEVLLHHQDRRYPIRSVFLRVSPRMKGGRVERWPYARLLDRLYTLIRIREERPLEEILPSIPRLDAMLGTTSPRGTKSPVAKWRTGRVMHRSAYEDIVNRMLPCGPERFVADKLYGGATLWHVLVQEAPEHVEWALDRFCAWWSLFRPDDFVDGPETSHPLNVLA